MAEDSDNGGLFGGIMGFFNTITGLFGEVMKWGGIIAAGVAIFAIIGKFFGNGGESSGEEDAVDGNVLRVFNRMKKSPNYAEWQKNVEPGAFVSFGSPVGAIGDKSGYVTDEYNKDRGNGRTHKGVDIGLKEGAPIYAPADGFVLLSKESPDEHGYGNRVTIGLKDGYALNLAHLDGRDMPQAGTWVKRGQIIGYMGHSGNAKGPHLHYELIAPDGTPNEPTKGGKPITTALLEEDSKIAKAAAEAAKAGQPLAKAEQDAALTGLPPMSPFKGGTKTSIGSTVSASAFG